MEILRFPTHKQSNLALYYLTTRKCYLILKLKILLKSKLVVLQKRMTYFFMGSFIYLRIVIMHSCFSLYLPSVLFRLCFPPRSCFLLLIIHVGLCWVVLN